MHHEWVVDINSGEFLYSAPGDNVTYELSPTEQVIGPDRRPDRRTEKWNNGIVPKSAAEIAAFDAAIAADYAQSAYASDPVTDALVRVIAELVDQSPDDLKEQVINKLVPENE